LFEPIVSSKKLGAEFNKVLKSQQHTSTRRLMQDAFERFGDVDGNFVEQFQTTGFSARVWELYLHECLRALGYAVHRPKGGVDFLVRSIWGRFAVEAVTANPSGKAPAQDKPAIEQDERWEIFAIRIGSALTSKLKKRYWEQPDCKGMPLVFALQAFFDGESLGFSGAAVERYLYGQDGVPGKLTAEGYLPVFTPVAEHRAGSKAIPSGFFKLPDAEHVSAVLFSNSGTLAKFSRLAVQEEPSEAWRLIRTGLCFDPDPAALSPMRFEYEVGDGAFTERWEHGLHVLHNPNAIHPLPLFEDHNVNEMFVDRGARKEHVPDFSVYRSKTTWVPRKG
jgi:hypothetical protein